MIEEKRIARASIGVNLMVIQDGKILLGKRKGIAGAGYWGLPGGRLDMGERVLGAAGRELEEETGLVALELEFLNVVHQLREEEHWIQFGFLVGRYSGTLTNKEPEVCEGWEWFEFNALPESIFPAHRQHIDAYLSKAEVFEEEEIRL